MAARGANLPYPDRMENSYPQYPQHFEVVMMRNGVSEGAATQDDFKRVLVTARDPLAALMTDEVKAVADADGFRAVIAVPPGTPTGPETMARRRALDADGSKNDWR